MIEGLRALFAAFPDIKSEVEDVIAEGDRVAIRSRMTGTHTGEFMGVPATGKTVSAEGIDIVRMNEEGKGVEHWGLMDQASMMVQLGLMPPPG